MSPPPRSVADIAAARDLALRARRIRAQVKRDLAGGTLRAGEVLAMAHEESETGQAVARMSLGDLMLALPGYGEVTVDRMLVAMGISGQRRLRALGPRQLQRLREVLP